MAGTKTTFFGSMFAFEQAGVDEVVDRFREGYAEDAEDAPFISYDKSNHVRLLPQPKRIINDAFQLFKLDKLNLLDDDTPETILRILKLFTEQQNSDPDHLDEKIRPLEGFLSRIATEQTDSHPSDLLDVGTAHDDQRDSLAAMRHTFTEWRPTNGDCKMLTRRVAQSIANQTSTELLRESNQGQVRLVHGNFSLAHKKLKNLEPLMLLKYQRHSHGTEQTNGNVLVTVDEASRPLIGFQAVGFSQYPGFHRIIVPPQNAHSLSKKYVCEARVTRGGVRKPHPNIEPNESIANITREPFSLWDGVEHKEVGDPINMTPRAKASSGSQSEITPIQSAKQRYLVPSKAADVVGWAHAIDRMIDPDTILPAVPENPASKRRRKHAIVSDDEDGIEQEEEERRGTTGSRCRNFPDSPPSPEPSRRRRIVVIDSDVDSGGTATACQSQIQSVGESCTSTSGEDFSLLGRSSQLVGEDRLLPEVSIQNALPEASFLGEGQQSGLLTNKNDVFLFDAEMPASLAKHFTVAKGESNGRVQNAAEQSEGDDSNLNMFEHSQNQSSAGWARIDSSLPRGRRNQGAAAGWNSAQEKPPDERRNAVALSEMTCSDLPQSRAYEATMSRIPNIMDDDEPLASPWSSYANPSHTHGDQGYASYSNVSGPKRQPLRPVSQTSISRGDSRNGQSVDVESKCWENHEPYKGRNLNVLRQEAIADLQAQLESEEAAKEQDLGVAEGWSTVSRPNQQRRARGNSQLRGGSHRGGKRGGGRQRKAADTVASAYRSTMSQKAPNPGKKRGFKQQPESAADRARKLKAITDSYGPIPTRVVPTDRGGVPQLPEMSSNKKAALSSSPTMATVDASVAQQEYRSKETAALKTRLQPIFEACRAFSGSLEFVIQFGQALLSANPHGNKAKAFDSKSWEEVFGADGRFPHPLTSFSNILTANGAEMDRILESRSPFSMSGKMFDKHNPGRISVTYEFHCRNKNGESFLLVLDGDRSSTIHNPTETVGSVCMQCPARIWDACATVQGVEPWNDDQAEIQDRIEELVDNIYIAPGDRLQIYFRQPAGNVLTINNPQLKRVSAHQCLLPGYENYQLRITEVKNLHTRNCPDDRKLWKAQEGSYDQMVGDGRLHYEMCLVDTSINRALEANNDLEVGELTDPGTTGKSLISGSRLQPMLELAVAILNKIDYMGFYNIGTMKRWFEAEARQQQSLPPTSPTRIQPLIPSGHAPATAQHASVATNATIPSETGTDVLKFIPGTRMNTRALVYADSEGNVFQKGMGGAIVPVAVQRGRGGISDVPVEPGDSASQCGAARSNGGRGSNSGMKLADEWSPPDDKGHGFW